MPTAVLLIAHGSRLPSANADLRALAEMVASRRPTEIVEYAYLELAEPTIPEALDKCVERGAIQVRMLPWFLSAGMHVTEDLTTFRREFAERHPEVECVVCPPLGLHPLMVEILLDRLDEQAETGSVHGSELDR